jgi:hypothetical protein
MWVLSLPGTKRKTTNDPRESYNFYWELRKTPGARLSAWTCSTSERLIATTDAEGYTRDDDTDARGGLPRPPWKTRQVGGLRRPRR